MNIQQIPDPSAPLSGVVHSRSARIKAFRAFQRATPDERERIRREMDLARARGRRNGHSWKAVHLLSAEEVKSLLHDIVEGLAFLVGILRPSRTPSNATSEA